MADRLIVGCGYLGRRVAALWRERGDRVLVTTRCPERAEVFRRDGLDPIVCDIHDPASLTLPRVETVLHCVGFDRSSGKSYRDVYVSGLANVLDALPTPGRFVYVSSTSVYGQNDGEEVDESATTEPVEEAGRVILEAERLLQSRLSSAVRLRFSGIYGPGRLIRAAAIRAGEAIPADPEKWLNLIHVADGAAAVIAAAESEQSGAVVNVSDDRPVTRRDYYGLLAQLLEAPEPRFAPAAGDAVNRRVSNRRMRDELRVALRYPSIVEGLPASL